jgi:hypothetical protein
MSTAHLGRDPHIRRLLDDGYDVSFVGEHLVVRQIPYVTVDEAVMYGALMYPLTVSGDQLVSDTDHRIWFSGTAPCNERGQPLGLASPEVRIVAAELGASFMLSSKPGPNGYPDHYEKVTAYTRILSHPAIALDESVTATPGAAWQEVEDDLPFQYRDTASSRAGLAGLNQVFRDQRIVIVGLGGTGGYILDQIAKTPVASILLIDGDVFDNHNAFRAPGAPSLDQLRTRPTKVGYFAELYGRMHTGICTAPAYINEQNLSLLDKATFVFIAMDDATMKPTITSHLVRQHIPFIDVGMGVEEIDATLARIPKPVEERDDYDRNVQVADLNALNAVLAIGRWKRHLGFYADGTAETFATYSIYTNDVTNEGT